MINRTGESPGPAAKAQATTTSLATQASAADLERLQQLLGEQEWIFAKTMPQNPHEYTLRRKWRSDDDFIFAVQIIRRHGYRQRWGKSYYTCLDVNDHFYWTMGWPIGTLDRPGSSTILINRK